MDAGACSSAIGMVWLSFLTNFHTLAIQISRLRAERSKFRPDPRFDHVISLIRSGFFGWEDYFSPICDAITGTDFYLTANDFAAYLDAQVG